MNLTFGPPGNLIAFPIHRRLAMTGRKPLGPATLYELDLYRPGVPKLKPTPKRKNVRPG